MQLPVLSTHNSPAIGEERLTKNLIGWTLQRFADHSMVITTGFGMEGCALIDMYASYGRPLEVIYLDTMFFFQETRRLIERMKADYPHLNFLNRGTTLTPEAQTLLLGDQLWERNPDECCRLRKVEPMRKVLTDVDVWVTALRRRQAPSRAGLAVMEWNSKYQVLQISPLARWSRQQVWNYVQSHGVPYNELHDRGYPSVGCTYCTQPVPGFSPDRYSREGRWAGTEKTECGLHT